MENKQRFTNALKLRTLDLENKKAIVTFSYGIQSIYKMAIVEVKPNGALVLRFADISRDQTVLYVINEQTMYKWLPYSYIYLERKEVK